MLIPWPEHQPEAPSERGWQPSLKRAAIPVLRRSKLVLHIGAIRGETTRDMLSSFGGRVMATDPLWPDGFHAVKYFFSTCWKFSDRVHAWAGNPIEFLEWVSLTGEDPDSIAINGDIGEKYPDLLPTIVKIFGHKPMFGTEVAKMNLFLKRIYPEFERFDEFSWRVNADLVGERWACPSDGNPPDGDWSMATPVESGKLLEKKGIVVFFCRTFGTVSDSELSRWYSDFAKSQYDVSISTLTSSFMAKGSRMAKVAKDGWASDIMDKCYEADVLMHVKV